MQKAKLHRILDKYGLTAQQREFVHHYMINGQNGKQAAISAGYSKRSAEATASRLLRHDNVSKAILNIQQLAWEKMELTEEKVIQELAKVAFSDMRDLFNENDRLLKPSEWNDQLAAVISAVDTVITGGDDPDTVIKIKTNPKIAALKELSEIMKMKVKLHEHTGKDGGPIETSDLTEIERAKRITAILRSAEKRKDADDTEDD